MKNNYDSYVESFLEYINYELNYSKKTATTYLQALKIYREFLTQKRLNFTKISADEAVKYKAYLIASGRDNKTSSLDLSAVRSFYQYLVEIKLIQINPFYKLKNPKVAKKLPNFLNNSESTNLFSSINYDDDLDVRNALIMEFLYATGLRVSEVVSIKLNDLDEANKTVRVLGKGAKERIVFYAACSDELMNRYINTNRLNILNGINSEYLFISSSGKPLTTRTIENIVKKYAIDNNVKSRVTPHTMRHTFATDLLNNGADIRSVGELLGHASLSTTQIYTHVTSERLKRVYNSAHPRGKMKK